MTVQLKALVAGTVLTNAAVTYYTAPTGVAARINNATVTNFDTVARTVTVSIGANATATQVILAKALQPNETYNCPELVGKTIPPGVILQALASANTAVNLSVSGIEQS